MFHWSGDHVIMSEKTMLLTGAALEAVRLFEERAKDLAQRRLELDRELEAHHAVMWRAILRDVVPEAQPVALDVGYLEEHGMVFLRYVECKEVNDGTGVEGRGDGADGLDAAGRVVH